MKTIWKFPVYNLPQSIGDTILLSMPRGAEILTLQIQLGIICLWCMVNPDNEKVERNFKIFGTGQDIKNPDALKYVDTFQLHNGALVLHLFEIK